MTARVRALQALFFAAYGTTIPYLAIYYGRVLADSNGVPNYAAVGTILSISTLVGLVSPLVAGYLADRFRINNRLITVLALLVVVGAIGMFLPGSGLFSDIGFALRFAVLFAGAIVNGLFVRPIIPLIDTETLLVLRGRDGTIERYGEVRAFGAIGWCVTASLSGVYIAIVGRMEHLIIFYASILLILAAVGRTGFRSTISAVRIPWSHLRGDKTFQRFLVFVALIALGMVPGYVFAGVYFSELDLNFVMIGLTFGLASTPEIPVLLNGRRIVSRIGSENMIIAGTTVQFIKFALLFLIAGTKIPFLFVLVMLLQGAGYSLQFAGFVDFMDRRAHEHLRATYQSLYHVVFSIGGAIGNFAAAWFTGIASARFVMALSGMCVGVAAIYFVLFVRSNHR